MKVCFFGSYTSDPAIDIFKKRLELVGIKVIEARVELDINLTNKNIFSIIASFPKLFLKYRKIEDHDLVILPLWWGAIQLPMLKLISSKPILYFSLGSPYDELVNDRKKISPSSLVAKIFYQFEKTVCKWSDRITKESKAEIEYYTNLIRGIDKSKFIVVPLSADESKFPPLEIKKEETDFEVLFFGSFIPLHGIEIIIEAARLLSKQKNIKFHFCGKGQTKSKMEELAHEYKLENVKFHGFVSHEDLVKRIKKSDVCLGIFGQSIKASIVISHKVFQILSSQRPLITMDSPATQEYGFKSKTNCMLVPKNDPKELADAIIYLKKNPKKRREIAVGGREFFVNNYSMEKTGKDLYKVLEEMCYSN